MAVTIQKRRGTAAQWTTANPTLASGEEGIETDTGKSKIGNGTAAWTALSYVVAAVADATSSAKGAVQLAGDLGGTAASPTVPGLAAKAPLASPTFTGTPSAPTPTSSDSSTKLATTQFVAAAVTALINGAPGILDTFGEIAAQLQSDESAAAALTTLVNTKAGQATVLSGVASVATLTAAGTLTANAINVLDVSGGSFTATLPTAAAGAVIVAEKSATVSGVTSISGTIRGVASTTITLDLSREELTFLSLGGGNWYPIAGHKTGASIQKLSNTPRVSSVASSATPALNTDLFDALELTAQAADVTSFTTNLSGSPVVGQKLRVAVTGTAARALAWGASFEATTQALPTTTVGTNRIDVTFLWNAATSKWRCVGVA